MNAFGVIVVIGLSVLMSLLTIEVFNITGLACFFVGFMWGTMFSIIGENLF